MRLQLKFISLFATAFIFLQCKNTNSCIDHNRFNCERIDLSEEYKPVCGCDGITYKNVGYAECEGGVTKSEEGACK